MECLFLQRIPNGRPEGKQRERVPFLLFHPKEAPEEVVWKWSDKSLNFVIREWFAI